MPKSTIKEAINSVLRKVGHPLSIKDIYDKIIEWDYYRFRAAYPVGIVATQIRRHCKGIDNAVSSSNKYYQILNDGRFWLIDIPIPHMDSSTDSKVYSDHHISAESISIAEELKGQHKKYLQHFKDSIIAQLKAASPKAFEYFSRNLLEEYGFKDLHVTQYSKDGGIDGFGKLKVGITFLDVAFQSKRWKNTTVAQKEIQSFRGAIQGKYEQGIYFTTSTYSKAAKEISIQKGAVPIILIDGNMIVDIMIEKKFGIEIENLPLYLNALDRAFTEER